MASDREIYDFVLDGYRAWKAGDCDDLAAHLQPTARKVGPDEMTNQVIEDEGYLRTLRRILDAFPDAAEGTFLAVETDLYMLTDRGLFLVDVEAASSQESVRALPAEQFSDYEIDEGWLSCSWKLTLRSGEFIEKQRVASGPGQMVMDGLKERVRAGTVHERYRRVEPVSVQAEGTGRTDGLRLALCNVLHPFAPLNARIGDLIVDRHTVHFLVYHEFQHGGNLAGAATLLGGAPLGFAVAMHNKDVIDGARALAESERERMYGLSLDERRERLPDSITIPIKRVDRLAFSSDESTLTLYQQQEASLEFIVPSLSTRMRTALQAVVDEFPGGKERMYDDAPFGLMVASGSPAQLAQRIISGEEVRIDELERIAQDERYMFALYAELSEHSASGTDELLRVLVGTPETFRKALAVTVEKHRKKAMDQGGGGALMAMGLLILGGFLVSEASVGWAIFFGLLFGLFIVVGIGMAWSGWKKAQAAKIILERLGRTDI